MARPREFDEDIVLDAAMNYFWLHGYETTSVRDLADHMGITPASLYNTFGDKRSLYLRCFKHYLAYRSRERSKSSERVPAIEAIEAVFREVVRVSLSDKSQRGCMLVNTAIGASNGDSELQEIVVKEFSTIESFFFKCVKAGHADGSIRHDVRPAEAAKMLLSILLGLRVLARNQPQRSVLEGAVRPALEALRA